MAMIDLAIGCLLCRAEDGQLHLVVGGKREVQRIEIR